MITTITSSTHPVVFATFYEITAALYNCRPESVLVRFPRGEEAIAVRRGIHPDTELYLDTVSAILECAATARIRVYEYDGRAFVRVGQEAFTMTLNSGREAWDKLNAAITAAVEEAKKYQ